MRRLDPEKALVAVYVAIAVGAVSAAVLFRAPGTPIVTGRGVATVVLLAVFGLGALAYERSRKAGRSTPPPSS